MSKNDCIILAIESSCDDTSAAVIINGEIYSNCVATQKIHQEYGGVVPELASRAHQEHILPVVDAALKKAKVTKKQLSAIAFTQGPGLMGSLMVGVSFAKAFALALDIPLIAVNHMKAHILAHFIDKPKPDFPFLCLTVSGGHTQIVKITAPLEMEILGETIDDAAGEAFDKTGKMLGLDYPAGPYIDKYAKEGEAIYSFTEPKIEGLNFSFSGLKTSILYFLKKKIKEQPDFLEKELKNICASVQSRIVSILMNKFKKAAIQENITHLAIAGGVSANSALRAALISLGEENNWNTYIPKFEYCTDNAAMIAMSAHFQYLENDFVDQTVIPQPRLKM